jgi:pimeloyl-ACP methyl ester carboxylesterase
VGFKLLFSLYNMNTPPRTVERSNNTDDKATFLSYGLMSPLSSSYGTTANTVSFGRYFSRQSQAWKTQFGSKLEKYMYTDEKNFVGWYSPWFFFIWCIFSVVPAAYVYIGLVVLREMCIRFPDTIYQPIQYYTPPLGRFVQAMQNVSWIVEVWCYIEALFYIGMKLRIKYLNSIDPLETSLAAAPIMTIDQRQQLWNRMMVTSQDHPIDFIRGWFFGSPIESISKYDIRDFIAWSMFEGRNQEHLTLSELRQLERFVRKLEEGISAEMDRQKLQKRKEREEQELNERRRTASVDDETEFEDSRQSEWENLNYNDANGDLKESDFNEEQKTVFRFRQEIIQEQPNLVSDLFESYRTTVMKMRDLHPSMVGLSNMVTNVASVKEIRSIVNQAANEMSDLVMNNSVVTSASVQELRNMVSNAANEAIGDIKFHPVQDLRNFMAETGKQLEKAEESAIATASQMYSTLVPSYMDKQLTAMSHATYTQLMDAWNSVKNMSEQLEMARYFSKQRLRLRQQLKGYRSMLNTMICTGVSSNSSLTASGVPSKQMAQMMRRITECNRRMDLLESNARDAFVNTTGFMLKNIPGFSGRTEPQRYAKYSSDPLLGLATYPLGFHLFVLSCSELPLRFAMKKRGFERCSIGPTTYYYHPGKNSSNDDDENYETDETDDDLRSQNSRDTASGDEVDEVDDRPLPFIFVHGIGVGLYPYMPLIDALLESGRPIFLPEIPYVSGFRPWQSANTVLQPAVVTSTMTAMLATHGYFRATWIGHSYGTTWLSYMCQFAPSSVAAIVFLDPICFGLHFPVLAKQFVYSRPDPGRAAYIVRTDAIVNYTIQRSFPWAWIELFLEHVGDRPCQIYLSEMDALVPVARVQEYFEQNQVPSRYYCTKKYSFLEEDKNDENNQNKDNATEKGDDDDEDDDKTVSNRKVPAYRKDSTSSFPSTKSPKAPYANTRCVVFRGDGHGDWTERARPMYTFLAAEALTTSLQAEEGL